MMEKRAGPLLPIFPRKLLYGKDSLFMDDQISLGGEEAHVDFSLAASSPSSSPVEHGRERRTPLGGMLKPIPFARVLFSIRRLLLVSALLFLVLFTDLLSSWPVTQPSTAFALAFKNPNSRIPPPAWLKPSSGKTVKPNLNLSAPAPATSLRWLGDRPGQLHGLL
jgi:hypothetical protein